MIAGKRTYGLFDVSGLELEYMVVERGSLRVKPVADLLFRTASNDVELQTEHGDITWSSELAQHMFELRTTRPVRSLGRMRKKLVAAVKAVNKELAAHDAMLLPTGSHPFMDPPEETVLWPHGGREIHQLCHELFDCRSHSWSNMYSAHLELPFRTDEEFGKLHAAARLLLPIIPALSASSPLLDGRFTGFMDSRMESYLHSHEQHPDLMGSLIPEPVYSQEEYYREVYGPIVRVLAEHDPSSILDHQFMNSRGVVPFFERNVLQVRVMDTQECISGDLAIAEFVTVVLKALAGGRWVSSYVQRAWPETDLLGIFLQVIKDAGTTMIANRDYLLMFGLLRQDRMQAMKLWQHLFVELYGDLSPECRQHIGHILEHGCLSSRILRRTGREPSRDELVAVYSELANCLAEDKPFT
jgi:glutamate---cysteine ligase / carboxylate-amine ligase